MMHICYVYIYKYRCLENVELVFDPRYEYSFKRDEMRLTIDSATNALPENFWGNGIWSLTGIFGNNGSGKSTAIRFLLETVVSGLNRSDVDGIVVYETNGKFEIYHNPNYEKSKKLTIATKSNYSLTEKLNIISDKIETFFFSGHFFIDNLSDYEMFRQNRRGFYNASMGSRLISDVEGFANTTDSYLTYPICLYLAANKSQHDDRFCKLLLNETLRKHLKSFEFPKYVIISPNRGGQDHLKYHPLAEENGKCISDYLNPNTTSFFLSKQEVLSRFVYFNLLNLYAADQSFSATSQIIIEWYKIVENSSYPKQSLDTLKQFKDLIDNYKDEDPLYQHLFSIYEFVSFIRSDCKFNDNNQTFYLEINKDKEKIESLIRIIKSCNFLLTSRFCDLQYSHDLNSSSMLSSGEEAMLNLFSSIYDAIEIKPQRFSEIKSPSLLLLDEAEIGFHPEWQRNYIKTLLDFIGALSVVSGHDYQIVITSHSPILQSDMPVNCCNFLKKEELGDNKFKTTNVRRSQTQTFATNVFELYRNSFFLENGLIGTFAEGKLRNLEKKCKEGTAEESEIDLIGDKRLREYFRNLIFENDECAAIKYYEKKLKELRAKQ